MGFLRLEGPLFGFPKWDQLTAGGIGIYIYVYVYRLMLATMMDVCTEAPI